LYRFEIWCLTWRAFESRALSIIFGPKKEEVIGGWRKLRDEGLHNLYSSQIIVKVIKLRTIRGAGHTA
jgi:hypothetical protein